MTSNVKTDAAKRKGGGDFSGEMMEIVCQKMAGLQWPKIYYVANSTICTAKDVCRTYCILYFLALCFIIYVHLIITQ